MCIVGAGLLVAGFVVAPTGVIDSSVLVAFGEILTFAGALFGIDYKYKKLSGWHIRRLHQMQPVNNFFWYI